MKIDFNKIWGINGTHDVEKCLINGDDCHAASVINHLLNVSAMIFMSQCILGGAYEINTEAKKEFASALDSARSVLSRYTITIEQENQEELEKLYAPDPEEPWWNK